MDACGDWLESSMKPSLPHVRTVWRVFPVTTSAWTRADTKCLLSLVIGWLLDKTVALLNFLRTYGSTGGVTPERPPWHGRCCFQWFLDETVTYVIAHVVSTS